jgi:hypothetical protein
MKFLVPALLAFAAPICALGATPDADSLLDAARQATGGAAWDSVVTIHETDKVTAGGLTGTADIWIDLPTLHNSGSYVLGPASGGFGWDGGHVWSTDSSKEVRIEASQEAVAGALQDAYRGAYAFYFPSRYPATRAYAGPRQSDGKTFEAVKITPKGADPFELWFDPTTHRINRAVQLTGDHPHSFIVVRYGSYGGLFLPAKSIDRIGNQPKYDIVAEATSITFGGPEQLSRYAPPAPPADTSQWPAGQDSVTVPFKLINNHIYVQAMVNGRGPATFVFDTGATNIINQVAAKRFGITEKGALPTGGFGDGLASTGLAKVKSVSLGGFTLLDQVFTTTDPGGWTTIEGIDSDGLLGYEFAKRAPLTIDYEHGTMTFTKPAKFTPPTGATAIPFTFQAHIPMVPAVIDGNAGELELDTGSRGALTLMKPFADAHGLVEKYHATILGTFGYGVGGPARGLLARGGSLVMGPVTVDAPVIEIAANQHGGGSETHTAGNIGGDILKRFTVTLDYQHQLLWLQPNAFAARREVFDRSGLWIARAGDGAIEIADVTAQSAAARAGLAIGDEILEVNGKPAKDIALYDLREQFKGAVGAKFDLRVKTKSGEKTFTILLADQV